MTKLTSMAMALLTVYFAIPEAYAEGNAQQNLTGTMQANTTARQGRASTQQPANRSAYEFQHQTLTQMVELPEIPQYGGQMSFVTGTYFPNAKSGASYTLKMRALENQETVRDWYKAALQQSGWKLEQVMCNEHTVAAWKGKQLVQVIVLPPSHNRFRSDVLMRYHFGS